MDPFIGFKIVEYLDLKVMKHHHDLRQNGMGVIASVWDERFGIRVGKYVGCTRARNVSPVVVGRARATVPYPPKPKPIAKTTVAYFISVGALDGAAAKDGLKP